MQDKSTIRTLHYVIRHLGTIHLHFLHLGIFLLEFSLIGQILDDLQHQRILLLAVVLHKLSLSQSPTLTHKHILYPKGQKIKQKGGAIPADRGSFSRHLQLSSPSFLALAFRVEIYIHHHDDTFREPRIYYIWRAASSLILAHAFVL